jgi:hypothetical protein
MGAVNTFKLTSRVTTAATQRTIDLTDKVLTYEAGVSSMIGQVTRMQSGDDRVTTTKARWVVTVQLEPLSLSELKQLRDVLDYGLFQVTATFDNPFTYTGEGLPPSSASANMYLDGDLIARHLLKNVKGEWMYDLGPLTFRECI